jgi:hypothetical protein
MVGVVTVNELIATWPPTSVAVTVVPAVPLGTWKVQLNAPVPFAVSEPLVQLETVRESNRREVRAVDTENPEPETVTVAPTGPWPGVATIAGVVTTNGVAGTSPVPTSVAWIECEPAEEDGTTNVHTNPPEAVVVIVNPPPLRVPEEQPANANELDPKVTVTVSDTVNPAPVKVARLPTGPWDGFTVMSWGVTVNVCEVVRVLVAASWPTTE